MNDAIFAVYAVRVQMDDTRKKTDVTRSIFDRPATDFERDLLW